MLLEIDEPSRGANSNSEGPGARGESAATIQIEAAMDLVIPGPPDPGHTARSGITGAKDRGHDLEAHRWRPSRASPATGG